MKVHKIHINKYTHYDSEIITIILLFQYIQLFSQSIRNNSFLSVFHHAWDGDCPRVCIFIGEFHYMHNNCLLKTSAVFSQLNSVHYRLSGMCARLVQGEGLRGEFQFSVLTNFQNVIRCEKILVPEQSKGQKFGKNNIVFLIIKNCIFRSIWRIYAVI